MKDINFVRLTYEEIHKRLGALRIPIYDGPYNTGKFNLKIDLSKIDKSGEITFWQNDQKENKYTKIYNHGRCLTVAIPGRRTNISDVRGLTLVKHYGGLAIFPHIKFQWVSQDKPEGILVYVEIDFGSSKFISYQKKLSGEGYDIKGLTDVNLFPKNLPQKLEETREILGLPFEIKIDIEKEIDAIISDSKLEEFLRDLQNKSLK